MEFGTIQLDLQFKKVIIQDGISSLSNGLFESFTNLLNPLELLLFIIVRIYYQSIYHMAFQKLNIIFSKVAQV